MDSDAGDVVTVVTALILIAPAIFGPIALIAFLDLPSHRT